jgi:hypothetical protein
MPHTMEKLTATAAMAAVTRCNLSPVFMFLPF